MLLEINKKKFVTAFFEHVLKNTPVFHFNDKIPSLHTSNIKLYQLTNVINEKNLFQMSI